MRGRSRAGAPASGSSAESGTSSMWLRPAFSDVDAGGVGVEADDLVLRLGKGDGER